MSRELVTLPSLLHCKGRLDLCSVKGECPCFPGGVVLLTQNCQFFLEGGIFFLGGWPFLKEGQVELTYNLDGQVYSL